MAHRSKIQKRRKTVEDITRPIRIRRYKYYFLIVCEDQNTEPTYFNLFRQEFPERTLYLESIGTGRDPLGVVEQCVRERDQLESRARKKIDKVWVVFDKDDANLSEGNIARFTQAFSLATEEDIHISLSNEVFELWLLLHFEDIDGSAPVPRASIYDKLETAINNRLDEGNNFLYEHGKSAVIDFVKDYGEEGEAIQRAKVLREVQKDKNPIDRNPSTDVDLLVAELREWIRYYHL